MWLRNVMVSTLIGALVVIGPTVVMAGELTGEAAVRAKDTRRNTIQLGEMSVRLDGDSVIRDASGERINLRALPVPDTSRGGNDLMLGSAVGRYVVETRGTRYVLRTLELISATH